MMSTDLLRAKVLELAVRGELLPQRASDEPVSELIDRIKKEKKQLLKKDKLKKKDLISSVIYRADDGLFYERVGNRVTCIQDQIPFDIPSSWCWVRLGQVAKSQLGKTTNRNTDSGKTRPYLCSINVYSSGLSLETLKETKFTASEREKYVLRAGDLLLCEGGDVGRAAVWSDSREMYYQNALHRIRFYSSVSPYFFKFIFDSYKASGILESLSKGVTIRHLTQTAMSRLLFPLPPVEEQGRIVARLDQVMTQIKRIEEAKERLCEYKELLRRGVLEEAIKGRLVEQRSEEGSAEPLLTQIEQEKKQLLKAGKLKKRDLISSTIYRGDDGLYYERVGKRITCIQDQIPFDIPSSWRWVRLGQIYKTTSGGTPRKRPEYYDGDIPWFRSGEIGEKYISHSEVRISEEAIANSSAKIFPAGSLLVTMYCETMGQASILKVDAATNQAICALNTCDIQSVNTLYLYYFFHGFRTRYQRIGFGSAQPNISQTVIRNTLFPLPPEGEQERIVERLDKLMAQIDRL